MEKEELKNFGVKTDQRFVNRKNTIFGYVWIPDAVVHDLKNRYKQKPETYRGFLDSVEDLKISIDAFEFYLKEKKEKQLLDNDYVETPYRYFTAINKKCGASIERNIMFIEQLYPMGIASIQKYKDKLYGWDKNGLID